MSRDQHPFAQQPYDGRRVLVTGATGLIGRALVPTLLSRGVQVRTTSTRAPSPALQSGEHQVGDLTHRSFAESLMDGIEVVFHLAGRRGSIGIQNTQAATMLGENLLICLNTLEAARRAGVGALVYTSTVSVYPSMALYQEDLAWSANPHPADQYAAWAKRIAEKQIEAIAKQYGMTDIAVVRPVNCFGPFDNFDPKTALVVPALIGRVEAGEDPLVVWGDGTAVRDFLYVDDVVDGLLRAYERGLGQGPINLGSGIGHSIREVVEAVLAATGRQPTVRWDTSRPAGEPRKVADIARAREILGFQPRTTLLEAIGKTVDWYRAGAGRRFA
ncbi:MAG: NAD-dependent epimerase/dehydratase family protein [Proteobacteria bacterium]|nr:NAD-dependent epimerase/dehydratase family protein [Pseudomonadota bacterium]MBI3498781.1 NAD-dependent epimerase/dehydratase family protein [Pseudomonadota bacterium]